MLTLTRIVRLTMPVSTNCHSAPIMLQVDAQRLKWMTRNKEIEKLRAGKKDELEEATDPPRNTNITASQPDCKWLFPR